MFMFKGKERGEGKSDDKQDLPKGICGPRERIAKVKAGLAKLDISAQSALAFDWGNCDSVAHESQRNSLRNTLVSDISDRSPRQGIKTRMRTRSLEDQCSEKAEKLLNKATTPLQHRCSSSRTSPPKRASSSGSGTEPRHVSLMFWPPEFIPTSCATPLPAHPPDSSPHGASVVGSLRTNRGVSAAALLLESRDQARAVVVPHLKGILVNRDTASAVSSALQPIRSFACWSWRQSRPRKSINLIRDVKGVRRPSELILDTLLSNSVL